MPRFNSRADWSAGVGGDGVALIVNGQVVDPGPGGAGDWLNDDEIAGARWTSYKDFRAVAINLSGQQRELRRGVFERVYAGGGRWATLGQGRWILDDGVETLPINSFGPDGSLATVVDRNAATGMWLNGRTLSTALVWDVQILSAAQAVWREADGPHAFGLPVPKLLPGESYGLRVAFDGVRWWVLYLAAGYNGQLVLHPFDSFDGYALTTPGALAYRADLVILGGAKHVIWATVESEQLGQIAGPYIAEEHFNLTDLLAKSAPAPTPSPEPTPVPVFHPNQLATIERIRAKYPTPLGATHPAFLIEVAQTLGVLLFKKDSGTHVTLPNGTNVSQDIVLYADDHEGFDILNDGEGAAKPTWSSKGTMVGEFVNVGTITPEPTPPVATAGEQLDASLKVLGTQIELLKGALAAQGAMIDTLRAKLDSAGSSDQINGVKVAIRADNGQYLCAEGGGGRDVNATRYAVGAWEIFTLERR